MNSKNPQDEMKHIIENCLETRSFTTATDCLNIYQNSFGYDVFYTECNIKLLNEAGPLVSLICMQRNKTQVEIFLSEQNYKNLEVYYPSQDNYLYELNNYLTSTNSKFICFFEAYHKYSPDKVANMVLSITQYADLDALICDRNFIDKNGTIIANADYIYQNTVNGNVFYGQQLIETSIVNNINIYGNLSTLLLSTKYASQLQLHQYEVPSSLENLAFFYQLLLPAKTGFINTTLVSTILQPETNNHSQLTADFERFISILIQEKKISHSAQNNLVVNTSCSTPIKREITFFYTDTGEYYNLKPIADEAKKRGYHTLFTQNPVQKAEIGIYCQHFCSPEHSRFSVILLHDLMQGHNRWPNIWEIERWNKFDIGILPGNAWANRWSQCACQYYTNPRCGAFNLGYPKNDLIYSDALKKRVWEIRQQLHLKYDISVLYAPSWENDGKEDDFVTALSPLKVNLLIKQASFPPEQYPDIVKNIQQMRKLHEGKYDNLYYIDTEESIQTALALCDFVISDESSVMAEAVMFNKPSIAVTDWLIPDTVPSRFAYVPTDYVIKCKKHQLKEYTTKLIQTPEKFSDILEKGHYEFASPSNVCKNILDAIEFFSIPETKRTEQNFKFSKLKSAFSACTLWN